MKVQTYTVRASAEQARTWTTAARAEGHASVGPWIATALDAYIYLRKRQAKPVPLAWARFGRFAVKLQDREEAVSGRISYPFGVYRGSLTGPLSRGAGRFSLVYTPTGRVLATLMSERACKGLAAELARSWVRWDGQGREPPATGPEEVLSRYVL